MVKYSNLGSAELKVEGYANINFVSPIFAVNSKISVDAFALEPRPRIRVESIIF
jgi:hypothetical protein